MQGDKMSQYTYDNDELIDTKNNIIIKYEDVIDVIHELENKNKKLSKKIKDMQINNANNNMFRQAFLSAYNHVADMDLPHDIKEEILEAFNKREIE